MQNQKNKNPHHDGGEEQRIDYLIQVLFSDEELSEEALDAICQWLGNGKQEELKEEALHNHFCSDRGAEGKVSVYADALWPEIAGKLGMNTDLNVYRRIRAERAARQKKKTALKLRVFRRVAAVLVPMLLVAGSWFWYDATTRRQGGEQTGYMATHFVKAQSDSLRHLILSDGTEVILNRNTVFSYNDDRSCELVGEAWFNVAKNPEHPFVIHSGHLKVTVYGTQFNLRARAEDAQSTLSLYEGVVELDYAAGSKRLDTPGHEFNFDHATLLADVHDFDTARQPEWLERERSSQLFMLAEIFDQIETAYGVTIVGRQAADLAQSYNFRLDTANSLRAVMEALAFASGQFDYTIQGDSVHLKPKHHN